MFRNTVIGAFLLISLSSCLDTDPGFTCLTGEGAVVSSSPAFSGNFNRVLHQFPGNLHITQGSAPAITLEGQQNLLDALTVSVVNEALILQFDECLDTGLPITAFISVTDLELVSLEGVGNVVFDNDIVTDELEVFLTGLGDFSIRGAADTLNINLAGQGNVRGFNFNSDLCDVSIVGSGDVEVTANNSLFVTITGQGNVFYKGNPIILSNINGLGTVVDAN